MKELEAKMCFSALFDAAEIGHFWFCLKKKIDMERQTEVILSLLALRA